MGAAYRARQKVLGRVVCIKFMNMLALSDPESIRRFRREARVLGGLRHPNIVTCFSFGIYEHIYPFLVMELVEGIGLRDVLRNSGALEPRRACKIIEQVCAALQYTHDAGFAHRDVKPDNIMLQIIDGEEHAKLVDFGLVKTSDGSKFDPLTEPGVPIGTPNYMPPEAFTGKVNGRSGDIYATGCVLYECLTGATPFEADSLIGIIRKHVEETLPDLPAYCIENADVRGQLNAIIRIATAPDPSKRFSNCREIEAGLRSAWGETELPDWQSSYASKTGNYRKTLSSSLSRAAKSALLVALVFAAILAPQFISARRESVRSDEKNVIEHSATVRLNKLLVDARQLNSAIKISSGRANHIVGARQLIDSLNSCLFEFGSLPEFGRIAESSSVPGELVSELGSLAKYLNFKPDAPLFLSFKAAYIDLLTCCSFYPCALEAVHADGILRCSSPQIQGYPGLLRFDETLQNEISGVDLNQSERRNFLIARLRPLAARIQPEHCRQLLKLCVLMEGSNGPDKWQPRLSQIASKMQISSRHEKGVLLCSVAKGLFNKAQYKESAEVFLESIRLTKLPGGISLIAADALSTGGHRKEAIDLVKNAINDASLRGDQLLLSRLVAKEARILAEDNQMPEAEIEINQLLKLPGWNALVQSIAKGSAEVGAVEAVSDCHRTLIACTKHLFNHQRFSQVSSTMDSFGRIMLEAGTTEQLNHYCSCVFWWKPDGAMSRAVVLKAAQQLNSRLSDFGFFCPRANFEYAWLLLRAERANEADKDAEHYFQLGEQQSIKLLQRRQCGDLVHGAEPLQGMLAAFKSTKFQARADALFDKIKQ